MKTLLISGEEMFSLLEMDEVLEAVEQAFKEKSFGRVQMPPKSYIFYQKYAGDLRIMPSYLESLNTSAVKIVNVHPQNRKLGLKSVMAIVILIDPEIGFPIAIMDGTQITAMRTGAASGVATKYLARGDSRVLGLIGAGVQARTQLMAIANVLKIERVKVFDKDMNVSKDFARYVMEKMPSIMIDVVESAEECVADVDVLCTVTPARAPIVENEWIEKGIHINAIGADAPGKEELEPMILKRSKIVVDDMEQALHSGEVNMPLSMKLITKEDIYAELGDIVVKKRAGRVSSNEITVFDATGIAILDAITARLAYKKALDKGVGQEIELIF